MRRKKSREGGVKRRGSRGRKLVLIFFLSSLLEKLGAGKEKPDDLILGPFGLGFFFNLLLRLLRAAASCWEGFESFESVALFEFTFIEGAFLCIAELAFFSPFVSFFKK